MITYSRTSFDQAVELAQLAKPWDTAPAEHVATLLSEAHAEALITEAFNSDRIFLVIDALIDAQPVSLVKSAPATYCSGSALPTRAHPLSYFTSTLRRNNLYLFAIACSKSV